MGHHHHSKDDMLTYARALAKELKHRWTDTREDVYTTLLDNENPVTAYQLLDEISQKNKKAMKPASVYRSLEALCAMELVVKIESRNAFLACKHPQDKHQHVFLVCQDCGHADEIADNGIAQRLNKDAESHGFKIERQILELQGSCKDCAS